MKSVKGIFVNALQYALSPMKKQYPFTLYPHSHRVQGRVLFSYLHYPLMWSRDDARFNGHSNKWESREIALIFTKLGYVVDAISYSDNRFVPTIHYDILFDISINLQRLAPLMDGDTIKILHRTGSDPYYQNRAEMERIRALEERRMMLYSPKRLVAYPDLECKSLEVADACSLLGNRHTLETYPEVLRHKMKLVTVSASLLGSSVKVKPEYVPVRKEFLCFLGGGAVHKGLDLLLEVFAKNKNYRLNIIGNVASEEDFLRIYRNELLKAPNIKYHGSLTPDSRQFREVIKNVFCFISPSCSEGMSPAVVTCMQIGLYPILSRDTGVSLPAGCGITLESCSISEIENAVSTAYQTDTLELKNQISLTQRYALEHFSRDRFQLTMEQFIRLSLNR